MPDRILIVDDEAFNLDLLEQELADRGYAVERARDGAEAVRKVESARPDLVLLDYMMPGMHGLDVMKAIRDAESDVPVVMMTAHGSIEVAVQAMKLGAYDFILKPFEPDQSRSPSGRRSSTAASCAVPPWWRRSGTSATG